MLTFTAPLGWAVVVMFAYCGKVFDFLLALVHQIIGRAAGGFGGHDLLVQRGDVAQVLVADEHVILDGLVQSIANAGELRGDLC